MKRRSADVIFTVAEGLKNESASLRADRERLREALEAVLRSAVPMKQNHPTMWHAWQEARAVLAEMFGE